MPRSGLGSSPMFDFAQPEYSSVNDPGNRLVATAFPHESFSSTSDRRSARDALYLDRDRIARPRDYYLEAQRGTRTHVRRNCGGRHASWARTSTRAAIGAVREMESLAGHHRPAGLGRSSFLAVWKTGG